MYESGQSCNSAGQLTGCESLEASEQRYGSSSGEGEWWCCSRAAEIRAGSAHRSTLSALCKYL